MSIERLHSVVQYVDDFERVTAFYRDVLGLAPVELEEGEYAEFSIGDGKSGNIAIHARHAPTPQSTIFLDVRDIERSVEQLSAKGAKVIQPPKRQPWGATAKIEDPGGNVIGLFERV